MKKLLELEAKLKKAKDDIEKMMDASMGPANGAMPNSADVNMAKEEDCDSKDKKADKKMMEEKMDEHNEKKHGEPKDEDSAMKSDIPKSITDQPTSEIIDDVEKPKVMETKVKKSDVVKFEKNGQWSMVKADESN